jgi:hypothetical protein
MQDFELLSINREDDEPIFCMVKKRKGETPEDLIGTLASLPFSLLPSSFPSLR